MSRPLYIAEQWGSGDRWRRFVFPATRSRNFTQALALRLRRGRIILVQHGDLECRFSCPPRTATARTFYDEPWLNPASAFAYGVQHRPQGDDRQCLALETDLTSMDLDRSSEKLQTLLGRLESQLEPEDVVLLSSTCLPSKLGDDRRIAELLQASPVGSVVLYNDPDVDQTVPPVIELVRRALERALSGQVTPDAQAINLVGFPRGDEKEALKRLLSDFGVTVNVDLIPDIDLSELERFGQAALTVQFPERHFNALYERLFDELDVRRIAPPPPYGWQQSYEWCRTIAAELGLEQALDAAWEALRRARLEPAAPLAAELRGCTVGFVGSRQDLKSLADPLQTQGVPVFAMLDEMGCEAEWLEHAAARPGAAAATLPRATFATAEQLSALLRGSACELVYSDIAWDRRITRAGKTPISLSVFRLGPLGFVRTVEHLHRARRLPFYRRYQEYLP